MQDHVSGLLLTRAADLLGGAARPKRATRYRLQNRELDQPKLVARDERRRVSARGRQLAGNAPAGMRLVSAPTGIFMIVGRVQVDGKADLPAVHALQDQFTITSLSVRDGGPATATPGAPRPDPRVREDLQWWERLRAALVAFPAPQADARFVAHAARFGATTAESPYVNPDPALAEALVAGVAAGKMSYPGRRSTVARIAGDA